MNIAFLTALSKSRRGELGVGNGGGGGEDEGGGCRGEVDIAFLAALS